MTKKLDLSGLRFVYVGLILQIVSGLITAESVARMMSGGSAMPIRAGAVGAAGCIFVLAGLAGAGEASPFFQKARKPFLIRLILQILATVFLAVLSSRGWSVSSLRGMERNTLIEMFTVLVIMFLLWSLAALFSARNMLRGCGHVAEQVNDPLFSVKCMKNWRLWYMAFLLMILTVLAGIAIMVTVLRKTLESGTAEEDIAQTVLTNMASSALLASIIVTVVLIFFLIIHIMYISKIRITRREYHMHEAGEEDGEAVRPPFAGYVQQEIGDSDAAEASDADPDDDGSVSPENGAVEDIKVREISGRKYRRITEDDGGQSDGPEESIQDTEETEQDPEDIMEITKLFKKNRR